MGEGAALRQRQLPHARERAEALAELAVAAVTLEMRLEEGEMDIEILLEAANDDDEEEAQEVEAAGGAAFTAEELAWGRKEAKARLGAEAFRAWRKAVKKAAKGKAASMD